MEFKQMFVRELDFIRSLNSAEEVKIPIRFLGGWGWINGMVLQINHFPDGMVIILSPTSGLLNAWPTIEIWVPRFGNHSGVLS
jgi:hypothetical protein